VISKAHEEGGDWTSSERLASGFLTLGITENHQQKSEKLKYIAFFPSETQILNFLSRRFSGNKRDYFFPNPYGSKI